MGVGYQKTDYECFDYELWYTNGISFPLRGPARELDKKFISFLGAAQVFGRFVHTPFPNKYYGEYETLNLGRSGAGPGVYSQDPNLLKLINKSEICFVQIMSARSVSAGVFNVTNNFGVLKFNCGKRNGETHNADKAYRLLKNEAGTNEFKRQIKKNQEAFILEYKNLLSKINIKVVFLWIANRMPNKNNYANKILGEFPHLVDQEIVDKIKSLGDILYCVKPKIKPEPFIKKYNNEEHEVFSIEQFPNRPEWNRKFNVYYADQELHDEVYFQILKYLFGKR